MRFMIIGISLSLSACASVNLDTICNQVEDDNGYCLSHKINKLKRDIKNAQENFPTKLNNN